MTLTILKTNYNRIIMKTLIKVDLGRKPEEQDVLHNRWHPDIQMVAMVEPGDEFRVECVEDRKSVV